MELNITHYELFGLRDAVIGQTKIIHTTNEGAAAAALFPLRRAQRNASSEGGEDSNPAPSLCGLVDVAIKIHACLLYVFVINLLRM